MENYPNLLPINPEKARIMGKKGGLVRSEKKRFAARLRMLKRKGLTDDSYQKLLDIIEDGESHALEVLLHLESIRGRLSNGAQLVNWAMAHIALYKVLHGEKYKFQNTNLNINLTFEQSLERWKQERAKLLEGIEQK